MSVASDFIQAFKRGDICLHPTDTLPGLTANPLNEQAVARLLRIKGYTSPRNLVHLAPSYAKAQAAAKSLSPWWQTKLAKVWPRPLTVAMACGLEDLKSVIDGSIAIRVPLLAPNVAWLYDVMGECGLIPSTSVNAAGGRACGSWEEARDFLAGMEGVHIPPRHAFAATVGLTPSTLIRISGESSYEILREGALPAAELKRLFV